MPAPPFLRSEVCGNERRAPLRGAGDVLHLEVRPNAATQAGSRRSNLCTWYGKPPCTQRARVDELKSAFRRAIWLWAAVLSLSPLTRAAAQDEEAKRKAGLDFYGFVMVDAIFDHTGIKGDWLGAARPTQLPAFEDEFGMPGQFFFGVKQTRFGVKAHAPTKLGEATAVIDFDFFGTGVDAGQTTLRLRHAYIELGQFLMGQTESPFMDLDIFPNELDYWGPNGMVFFRNVQFRWTPIQGDNVLEFALERPGASGDQGSYVDRIELTDVVARFPVPDFSAAFKWGGHDWGYLRLAGMLRYIKWDDLGNQPFDLAGDAVGWGLNLSSNVKTDSKGVLRLSAMYGAGVENYMNDAPVDIGIENNFSDPLQPIRRHGPSGVRTRGVLRPHLEREVVEHDRLVDDQHRELRRPAAIGIPPGPVRPRRTSFSIRSRA